MLVPVSKKLRFWVLSLSSFLAPLFLKTERIQPEDYYLLRWQAFKETSETERWGKCFVSTAGTTRADLVRRNPICLFTLLFQKSWMKIPIVRQITDQWKKERKLSGWVARGGFCVHRGSREVKLCSNSESHCSIVGIILPVCTTQQRSWI